MTSRAAADREEITRVLGGFIRRTRVREVHFAQGTAAPPPLAYVTNFPRLSVTLSGRHGMELAQAGSAKRVGMSPGHVVFVGRNCWNKPDWGSPVKMLTLLFGKTQIGVSLVTHDGRSSEPPPARKTVLSPFEGVARHVLGALSALAVEARGGQLARLLCESLLHECLYLLDASEGPRPRKAARSYEALCLYVEENFHRPITRESVAEAQGLTPNHVSRLFRREGGLRFSDYLTQVRIDRAKFMLRQYRTPLKEVAGACGYSDLAYFCRVFRRMTRQTPTAYRLSGR